MKNFVALCAFVLTVGGFAFGAASAYAEGDGCKTYFYAGGGGQHFCSPDECINPGEKCLHVTTPYNECACNGTPQIPFCEVLDTESGPGVTPGCVRRLCPVGADCDMDEIYPFVFICYCQ